MKTIHTTCAEGKIALVKRLVKEDKSLINKKDRRQWTPLFYACATGNEELVQFLLKEGANVTMTDNRKRTAMHIAVSKKCCGYKKEKVSPKIVKLLLEAGADPNAEDTEEKAALEYLTKWFILQTKWMSKIFCVLLEHGAMLSHLILRNVVLNGKVDIIEACLKHGADINRTTECHGSLLHAVDFTSDRYFHVLGYLLKHGCTQINIACPPSWPFEEDDENKTALSYALCADDMRGAKLLLEQGARVDIDYPLHFLLGFVVGGYLGVKKCLETRAMVKLLVNHGALMDLTKPTGTKSMAFMLNIGGVNPTKKEREIIDSLITFIICENAVRVPKHNTEIHMHFPCEDAMEVEHYGMYPHLYELGYKITEVEKVIREYWPSEYFDAQENRVLETIISSRFWSLQRLCRKNLRRALGAPITKKVQELPLPQLLKEYLCIDVKDTPCH